MRTDRRVGHAGWAGYFYAVSNADTRHRILVVGQTPPPYGGQAVMIQALLQGRYEHIRLFHVRMAFSEDMESVGRFQLRKVWVLFVTIGHIWFARLRHRTTVLYYPPAGPEKVPVFRDIILLCATRWMFKHTVFHFHAGGVSGFTSRLSAPLRPLFRSAYRKPSLAIRTAIQNPDDGAAFGALRNVVIPNGIADDRGRVPERTSGPGGPIIILFTGVLIIDKGVHVLLQAFQRLVSDGFNLRLQFMGKWADEDFRRYCMAYVQDHELEGKVEWLGVRRDLDKLTHFAGCDIFCFPSFFRSESFGLVLVEAMQFAKPLVSTRWRGIPSVVEEGRNGYLVEVRDVDALAERLQRLCLQPDLRKRMGDEGRRIFVERFTLEAFHRSMERELANLFVHS